MQVETPLAASLELLALKQGSGVLLSVSPFSCILSLLFIRVLLVSFLLDYAFYLVVGMFLCEGVLLIYASTAL